MWKVKENVIPVIIGATGTISKSFRKYLRNIMGKHTIQEMQKTATFGYCTHALGSTNKKYRMFNMENNITCTTNCNYRIDVILYTILTWFVPGIQLSI
jgi:hypothetical protein